MDSVGEGEGGNIWENGIETCRISCMKGVASLGSMHYTGCLGHARPLCPSPTPRVHSNSCPSSWWYHPVISSSDIPFSSHLQSCPESGSFWISQFFTSGSQSIGASASASVLPMNMSWFPLGLTGLISLQSKGLSRVFSSTTIQKQNLNKR